MKSTLIPALIAALLSATSAPALACGAHDASAIGTSDAATPDVITLGDLELAGPFTRETPPNAMAGGGFITITNKGSQADRLIAASSPRAPRVELHTMTMDNGVMRMREMEDGIEIPAGETVSLAPGGLHVMFMELPAPFVVGESVDVTLTFEKAGTVTVTLPVMERGMGQGQGMQMHRPAQ